MMKKLGKFLALVFFFCNILISTVQAEIKTYTGIGEFLLTSENLDYAKNKAKLDGMRAISEEICLKIQSSSEVKNFSLVHDEIIAMSESLLNITEVKYKFEGNANSQILKAFVTAEVDTEEVEKIIKKFEED